MQLHPSSKTLRAMLPVPPKALDETDAPHVYPKGCFFHSLDGIKGKRITVMGLGLNGGGEAAVRFFLRHGAFVIATDMKSADALRPTIDAIALNPPIDSRLMPSRLTYHLGGHNIADFVNADCVIKNPAVKFNGNKFLKSASAAGVAIESDLSVFLALSPAPIIAVTGSKGKSSTVSALHWILKHTDFNAFIGGNITVSPLTFLEETAKDTPVVLELSSWQLADLRGRGLLRARISIITKIISDHQNWYGNMANYINDKRLIYADQGEGCYAIFDGEGDAPGTGPVTGGTWGELFSREASERGITVLRYARSRLKEGVFGAWQEAAEQSTEGGNKGDGKNGGGTPCKAKSAGKIGIARLPSSVLSVSALKSSAPPYSSGGFGITEQTVMKDLCVPGDHVRTNALNAALAALLMGAKASGICKALSQWQGIEHRLQFFHEWNGCVRFYDDSCSTVAEAACAACASFASPVVLIAGGTDKGLGQESLAQCIKKGTSDGSILLVYLLKGSATERLTALLCGTEYRGPFASLNELLCALKEDLLCLIKGHKCTNASCNTSGGNGGNNSNGNNGGNDSNGIKCGGDEMAIEGEDAIPVVFSPGATSFGMFSNEFDRGDKFQEAVISMF